MADEIVVKEPLTSEMIEAGKNLIERLDEEQFNVTSSFWWYTVDVGEWRLVIASPVVDTHGPKAAYEQVLRVLSDMPQVSSLVSLRNIAILSPREHVVRLIGSFTQTPPDNFASIRISRSWINNQKVEDAYIYRAA
jgi:hypothetical protein